MQQEYLALLTKYGVHLTVTAGLLQLAFITLFSLRYIRSNTEHGLKKKLFDIIAMFLYIAMFFVYLLVGILFTGYPALGVSLGIAAFWGVLNLKSYLQRTHAEKMKNKRRAEIERIKRQR